MIGYHTWRDLYCPAIICDACQHQILHDGNTYWLVLDSGEIHPQIWHTHKECANYDRVIERTYGGMVLWEDVDDWLNQLAFNLTHPLPERAKRLGSR